MALRLARNVKNSPDIVKPNPPLEATMMAL